MECICNTQTSEPIASIIISIIAVLISITAIVIEKHNSRSQLKVEFFSDLFKEALSNKIPDARSKLVFQNERVVGCEKLQDALAQMRRDCIYFKYADPKFYNIFESINQEAEDYFIGGLNKNFSENRQKEFLLEGDKILQKLYKTINKKYFG